MRFQAMAPISAATIGKQRSIKAVSNVEISIIFFPMVMATAVPKERTNKFTDGSNDQGFSDSSVAMIVATTLATSWKPFEK
jgi:hypothetical protein